jgi:hypothetical protein
MIAPNGFPIRRELRLSSLATLLLSIGVCAAQVRADLLILNDGRKFEGRILPSKEGDPARIDTKVEGVRVILGFNRDDIKDAKLKDLPAGFFDPPPAEARVSDPKNFRSDQTLYLEVPLVGAPGKQYFAMGIDKVLTYARANRIGHLVFTVDSTQRNPDEAQAIYNIVKKGKQDLKLHAMIKQCRGAALAAVVWCDSIHILPGGQLGGEPEADAGAAPTTEDAAEQELVWAGIADRVVRETSRSGLFAELVRALIDPMEQLAVWKDASGRLQSGREAPADLAKDKLIISTPKGQRLTISYDQGVALGMKPFKGSTDELGTALKLRGWTAESDYGQKTMARMVADKERVAAEKERKEKKAQADFEAKAKTNVSRRAEIDSYVQHCVEQAAEWDPSKSSYATYGDSWNWGWAGSTGATKWTSDSQKKWKTRSDATTHYLKEAIKGLTSLKRLDAEAVKLGLDPTYQKGALDEMIQDLTLKHNAVNAQRDRTGE